MDIFWNCTLQCSVKTSEVGGLIITREKRGFYPVTEYYVHVVRSCACHVHSHLFFVVIGQHPHS